MPIIEHSLNNNNPPTIEAVLLGLFRKLTANNPP